MAIKINIASKLLSKDFIEDGIWIHLNGPGSDPEPLYADAPKNTKPCRALVRSHRCTGMVNLNASLERKTLGTARMSRQKLKDLEAELKAQEQPRRFAVVLAALENCSSDLKIELLTETQILSEPTVDDDGAQGKPLAYNAAYDWLHNQVLDTAYKDELYDPVKIADAARLKALGEAPAPAGNVAAPASEKTA